MVKNSLQSDHGKGKLEFIKQLEKVQQIYDEECDHATKKNMQPSLYIFGFVY